MTRIGRNNRTCDLLGALGDRDGLTLARLALLTGTTERDLQRCRDEGTHLPNETALAIARAVEARVPRLAREARRLEAQARAAIALESGNTERHMIARPRW